MSAIKYRSEIDGLRSIAIIPVILFHLGYKWIGGGYLGVDVFFVISGYLITSIILKETYAGTFSYKKFWIRRVRRIMPALLVMIILILFASCFIIFRPNLTAYLLNAVSAIFSYANIQIFLTFGDYWSQSTETVPFLHAWSLSVEEQFYIIFPIFLVFLLTKKIKPLRPIAVIALLSYTLFIYSTITHPNFGFYSPITRAWELLSGSLLAISIGYKAPPLLFRFKNFLPSVGLLLIMLSFFVWPPKGQIDIIATLPVLGSVLIINFASANEPIGRLLGSNPFVYIGKISYSLYLWHWPVIVLAKQYYSRVGANESDHAMIMLLITIALSIFSYYLVEIPTRKMKNILILVPGLILVVLVIRLVYTYPLINLTYKSNFNKSKNYIFSFNIIPEGGIGGTRKLTDYINFPRDSKFNDAYRKRGIIAGYGTGNPEIVIIGDSHGSMWAKVIAEIGEELKIKESFYTTTGHSPFFNIASYDLPEEKEGFTANQWNQYAKSVIGNLNAWRPKLLIIACNWAVRSEKDLLKLNALLKFTEQNKIKVLLFNQPPIITVIGNNNAIQYLSYMGYKPNNFNQYMTLIGNSKVNKKAAVITDISKKHSNTMLLDINTLYRLQNKSLIIKGRYVLYLDDDHLSYEGTLVAKQKIKEAIKYLLHK